MTEILAFIAFVIAAILSCTRYARWWPLLTNIGLALALLAHSGADLDD